MRSSHGGTLSQGESGRESRAGMWARSTELSAPDPRRSVETAPWRDSGALSGLPMSSNPTGQSQDGNPGSVRGSPASEKAAGQQGRLHQLFSVWVAMGRTDGQGVGPRNLGVPWGWHRRWREGKIGRGSWILPVLPREPTGVIDYPHEIWT